jgi:hypothetical protein
MPHPSQWNCWFCDTWNIRKRFDRIGGNERKTSENSVQNRKHRLHIIQNYTSIHHRQRSCISRISIYPDVFHSLNNPAGPFINKKKERFYMWKCEFSTARKKSREELRSIIRYFGGACPLRDAANKWEWPKLLTRKANHLSSGPEEPNTPPDQLDDAPLRFVNPVLGHGLDSVNGMRCPLGTSSLLLVFTDANQVQSGCPSDAHCSSLIQDDAWGILDGIGDGSL